MAPSLDVQGQGRALLGWSRIRIVVSLVTALAVGVAGSILGVPLTAEAMPTEPRIVEASGGAAEGPPQALRMATAADHAPVVRAELGDDPVLAVGGEPLQGSNQSDTFTVDLVNGDDIVGDVTWLLDDSYYDKSHAVPHSMEIEAGPGDHKLKARWVEDGVTVFVQSTFTVGAYLSYADGLPLGSGNVAAPLLVTIANGDSIDEEVTWLLDEQFLGVDEEAPYEWQLVAGIGEHTLTARWPGSGTSTVEITSLFTVQTDLTWTPPAQVVEEPAPALEDLWVTADNRREAVAGLYDWSKAGFGGGASLPTDANVRSEGTCQVEPAEMVATFDVIPNDGIDDTAGIQAAIDHVKANCSPTGSYTSLSRIVLPQGTLNVSREISVDADYLIIRGAGSDPETGTRIVYLPDANTRYDKITSDGTQWDIDAMGYEEANGGWIWPGRGLFRVQSREVAPQYLDSYAAAPENRRDLFEGTVNDHWTTGLTLRSKPGDAGFAARAGDTVVYLANNASFDNLSVGGLVNVMVANSMNFYDSMEVFPTDHPIENLYMRQQIFMVVSGDPFNHTITLDKPLEYDVAVTSVSDGSEPIDGVVRNSKVSPLVDAVVGVGFEDLYITQDAPGLDRDMATANYGNMDPAGAMHGIVFKWAANSWVRGIKTEMTGSHPIVTEYAANLSIVDNYFDGAWNKGKGGNGYVRGSRVWDSLYAGNTLRNLRHFTFQWSSSGNVFIGNSLDADLNLHGGYERNNLFELNEVSVPYTHRPGSCWTNCGGEGNSSIDAGDWYPIWWAAGKKAVKWSGSSGPNNVFFNNYFRKQFVNDTTQYEDWTRYSQPGRIYQFGVDEDGDFHHLDDDGTAIPDWAGVEDADYTDGHGVVDTRTDAGRSLFLVSPVMEGYSGPNPQPLRRTWGCTCWDGRGMVNTRLAADPVNTASGALMENFTDLSLASTGAGMTWSRTYNSLDPTPGPFGPGWTFDHNASLDANGDGYFYLREPTGAVSQFAFDAGSGSYSALDPGVTATLANRAGGGWVATSLTSGTFEFDPDGQLIRMADDRGFGVTLTYASGQLSTITDDLGQSIEVVWVGSGSSARITAIESSDGLSVAYGYATTAGELRLVEVAGIDGEVTDYAYDSATGFLNEISDPEGGLWARTEYDSSSGRVISQIDPTGAETTFGWDAGSQTATITYPNGEVRQDIYQGNVLVAQVDNVGRVTDISYDDDNHPIAESTSAQERTLLEYDAAGNLVKRTIPASATQPTELVETWTYDAGNRVLTHTDFLGGTVTNTYDGAGNLLTATDPTGATTTWTYNTLGQALTETDPIGRTTVMAYDTDGDLRSVTTPGGSETTYTYDAAHNRITETGSLGNVAGATAAEQEAHTTHWTYDEFSRVLTVTDPLDRVTTNVYDDLGRLLETIAPNGATTTYTYDDAGNVLTTTDEAGNVTLNEYDDEGNLVRQVKADDSIVTWEYDELGQMVAMTDPIGNASGASPETIHAHTTRYDYDTAGRQTTVRIPDPDDPERYLATVTTYDALGRAIAVADPTGAVARTKYDALGRITQTIDPTGVAVTVSYDAAGRELSKTENGATITNVYDAAGQLLSRTTDDGAITTYEYDLNGNLGRVVEPRGNIAGADPNNFDTHYEYDEAGNRTAVVDPLGNRTETVYDAVGNVLEVTDPASHTVENSYDILGNVATVTSPTGAVTTYEYNLLGRLVKVINPNGGETTATFDELGRKLSETTPAGRTTNYQYDLNGNLTVTDLPDGEVTRSYNSAGQVTLVDYSDTTPDIAYSYDDAGRSVEVSNGIVSSEYTYDLAGRVTEIARGSDTFTYGYDGAGRLVSREFPDGRTQAYTWGAAARLASVQVTAFGVTNGLTYTYDVAGHLATTVRSNGPTTTNTYDVAGHLIATTTVNGSTAVSSQTIQWSASGLPLRASTTQYNSTKTVLYWYDEAGQLTSVCSPTSGTTCTTSAPKVTYTYDDNGNRATTVNGSTTTTYSYDADDRLTQSTAGSATTNYNYGGNGDLETVTAPTGTTNYVYGLDGNLYNATLEDGRDIDLTYDEAGNRVSRYINGTVNARWVWDTNGPHPVRVNESVSSYYRWFEDPQSTLGTATVSVSGSGEATWLIPDFIGSVIATAKTAGATAVAKYDGFGTLISGSMSQPLQFHGQYRDSVLGLYDMRQRDYSSTLGRFTGTDPVGAKAGTAFAQTYNYALNSPTGLTDPSGGCPICISALVGLVAGGVIGGITAAVTGGNVWQGIGTGALIGGISGLTFGAGSAAAMAAFGGSRIAGALVGAYFGAIGAGIGNAAAGAYYTARSGGTPSWRQAGRDFSSGAWSSLLGAGIGGAAFAAARAAAAAAAKAAAARAWLARQNPGPKPADLNDIKCATQGTQSGPGKIVTVNESMSDRAAAFQSQVTGQARGSAYEVNGVKFDGYVAGELVDAKGPGYAYLLQQSWSRTAEELRAQAVRQVAAAGGAPIRWVTAEADAVGPIGQILEGLPIKVVYQAPRGRRRKRWSRTRRPTSASTSFGARDPSRQKAWQNG